METPKLIHQTWKTNQVPDHLQSYQQSWLSINPSYQYTLHTDEDIDQIVRQYAPDFYDSYRNFYTHIERVDFVRYVLLYEFGGIYADLDEVCIKPLDDLVAKNQIVLGYEPVEHNTLYQRDHILCNAFMISPPKQQFWMDFMNYIIQNYDNHKWIPWKNTAIYRTGPMALTLFYDSVWDRDKYNVCLLSSCAFFPMTDRFTNRTVEGFPYISRECHNLSQTYAIHCWEHGWLDGNMRTVLSYKFELVTVLLIMFIVLVSFFIFKRFKR